MNDTIPLTLARLKLELALYVSRLQTDLLHLVHREDEADRLRSRLKTSARKVTENVGDVTATFERDDKLPDPPAELTEITPQVEAMHQQVEEHFEISDAEHEQAARDADGLVNAIADMVDQAGYPKLAANFRPDEPPSDLPSARALLVEREHHLRAWVDPERVAEPLHEPA